MTIFILFTLSLVLLGNLILLRRFQINTRELVRSEQRYRKLFEGTALCLCELDLSDAILALQNMDAERGGGHGESSDTPSGDVVDMRSALEQEALHLEYRPQMDVEGRFIGAEVLLRWSHTKRGLIPPDTFVSVAEENGQILQIGEWVLHKALRQYNRWRDERYVAAFSTGGECKPDPVPPSQLQQTAGGARLHRPALTTEPAATT